MNARSDVVIRPATLSDVSAMARCRLADPGAGPSDPRMSAYLEGRHHPQGALGPRIAFVALIGNDVIGYIAGHRTERHGCSGEVQYLFVAPTHRRSGVGTSLLRQMADWFVAQGAKKVCVGIADDSPPEAKPFVERTGARPLKKHWHAWQDIGLLPRTSIQVRQP